MSKRTTEQRRKRAGQPYTRIASEVKLNEVEKPQEDGSVLKGLHAEEGYSVFGYTLEEKLQPDTGDDPEWALEWEEHELGHVAGLAEAHSKAAEWRESLVGVYTYR